MKESPGRMVAGGISFRKCLTDRAMELMWPGVPVTACASNSPGFIEDAGREIARLADHRAEGDPHDGAGLFLDQCDQPIPHHLVADFLERVAHIIAAA